MTRLATILALIGTFISAAAHAQFSIIPAPDKRYVCADKSDAYKLALADMHGTADPLVPQFIADGRCKFMPATYLFTIDRYVDSAGKPSRVIEATAYGERVWGIMGEELPDGVWLISHH